MAKISGGQIVLSGDPLTTDDGNGPSVGRAASAIAVSPNPIAWSTVSVPKTPIAISTYVAVVNPSARPTALGSSRLGSRRFATVNVITPKPRNAKNVNAMLATIFENEG